MAIPSQGSKTCGVCGQEKPVGEYYSKNHTNKYGSKYQYLSFECKVCQRRRNKIVGDKARPVMRKVWNERAKTRRNSVKDLVFRHYGGWKCACCGETEKYFLTLDHVNNDGAEFRKMIAGEQHKGGGYVSYNWLRLNNFPAEIELQVLCANCQHGKRMNGGICPHLGARRNDHPVMGVESSDSKRIAATVADDMVWSANRKTQQLV